MGIKFKYELGVDGYVIAFGYIDELPLEQDGSEPWSEFDIQCYKKNMTLDEWEWIGKIPEEVTILI